MASCRGCGQPLALGHQSCPACGRDRFAGSTHFGPSPEAVAEREQRLRQEQAQLVAAKRELELLERQRLAEIGERAPLSGPWLDCLVADESGLGLITNAQAELRVGQWKLGVRQRGAQIERTCRQITSASMRSQAQTTGPTLIGGGTGVIGAVIGMVTTARASAALTREIILNDVSVAFTDGTSLVVRLLGAPADARRIVAPILAATS